MTSIIRTLTVSLSLAAVAIFLIMIATIIWVFQARDDAHVSCLVASDILGDATVIDPGRPPVIRATSGIEKLKSNSPNLWYVVSHENLITEFGRERRPALPFALPYSGPFGSSLLNTLDQQQTFCLAVVRRGSFKLVMMIGDAQIRLGQLVGSFFSRNVFEIALVALALASTVAVGVFLSGRFVARSIKRVTRLALAIDPAAPQGSIALDAVPLELKPLAKALNRAFDEIHAYIRAQRRFLGNAAHQLRTPLTLLRAKIEDVAEPALKAELVRDVRRLTSLVSAMLDLARLQNQAIEKQPVDLAVVMREVLADFSPSALDAGIELSLEPADEVMTMVQGVDAAIRSALANLVGNALIHARGARRIVATLRYGSVSIGDDGAGLAAESSPELIEPFQTGNSVKQGAGLGLAIVQEIMAAHGGSMSISSGHGRGTTVRLLFPEAIQQAQHRGPAPAT